MECCIKSSKDKQLQLRVHFAHAQLAPICLGNTSNMFKEIRSFWIGYIWVKIRLSCFCNGGKVNFHLVHLCYLDLGPMFNMAPKGLNEKSG